MELSRRDALTALGAAGITATAGCSSLLGEDTNTTDDPMGTMIALADVLYPSDVDVSQEFVQTYLFGRIVDEESYRARIASGIETLDSLAEESQGAAFAALDSDQRATLMEESELRSADSVADGSAIERVNYHLIDELLFAFYASPTGGELVGNKNPQGWPGGFGYVPEAPQ